MNLKTRLKAGVARKTLKAIVVLYFLLHYPNATALGQTPATDPMEIYAGIELTPREARAIALGVSGSEEEPGLKLIYSENVPLALGRDGDGQFAPQAVQEATQTVLKLLTQLKQQYKARPERLFLIGSSGLGADCPAGLVKAISEATGKTLVFLDVDTEVQLSIGGTISRLWKAGGAQIDNRNSSLLIEINSDYAFGGYQLLRLQPYASPRYDFVTMSLPHDAAVLRQALRGELETKPGLLNRKRVYLAGSVAWAVATLLYPENRQTFVPLTHDEILWFAEKVARSARELLNPNLSAIRDRDLRQKVELELQAVRSAFTLQQLIAGAEALKAVASELEWQEKQIWFARFGYLGCLLSYVRLQAEK